MRRKGVKYEKNQPLPCPKCSYETVETKAMSMSTKAHKFGRQQKTEYGDDDEDGDYDYDPSGGAGYYGGDDGGFGGYYDDDSDDYDDEEDEEEEDETSDKES